MVLTKLLEESPGVRSMSRVIAGALTVLTLVIGATTCYIAVYSIRHARDHEEHAAAVMSSAGSLISMLTLFCAPIIGGIWIALGLRKKAVEDSTVTTTQVTTTGPATAAPTVAVTPAVTQ